MHLYIFCRVDAKAAPASAVGSDVAGVRNATSGSSTDKLTRDHRMTLDEAHLILNTKPGTTLETVKSVRIPLPHPQNKCMYSDTAIFL